MAKRRLGEVQNGSWSWGRAGSGSPKHLSNREGKCGGFHGDHRGAQVRVLMRLLGSQHPGSKDCGTFQKNSHTQSYADKT